MNAPLNPIRILAAPFAALLAAVPAFAQAPGKVTYVDHVLPIFRNACNNCHNPDKKKAGLDLTTYGATMAGSENGPVVKPGQGDASLLFKVCSHTEEPKMPPKGSKLSDAELGLLKNWIAGFALETATSKPAAVAQNNVAVAVVSLERPDGPPPMPGDLPLEPVVKPRAATSVVAMAASPWAPLLAVGGQKQVVLYNTDTLQPAGVLPFPEGFPQVLRFSRNGQLLLAGGGFGGKSGGVVLWNITDGKRAGAVGDETDQVIAADLSPDQAHVALGGPSKILKIYSTKDGKLEHRLKKHTEWVTAVTFSPDGKYLASADRNGGLMVWEGATGKEYQSLPGHKTAITALAFMPGVLASAGADGKIILWNIKEGVESKNWNAHAGGVEWIDFTPDGRLVSCGRDKLAKVWDIQGKALFTSEAFGDIALRAGLASERVVAADWTGRIRAFGMDGKPVAELTANVPSIADQMAEVKKKIGESEGSLPGLQKTLADAEAKLKADIAAAEKSQADAKAAIEAAKAAVASNEKTLGERRAEVEKLQAAHKAAEASTEQDANVKKAAIDQAAKAVEEAKKQVAAVEGELNKAKGELPKVTAAQEKAIAEAGKRIAELNAPAGGAPATPAVDKGKVDQLQKKLSGLVAKNDQRRAERAKFKEGTPEYNKANEAVQAAKPEIAKVEADIAAANNPAAAPAKGGAAQTAIANARAAMEACQAAIAAAQADMQRLDRASAYMGVHRAELSFEETKSKHEELVATAKDALRESDLVRQRIASLQTEIAAAPGKIKQAEDALAAGLAAAEDAKKAVSGAQAAIAAKEETVKTAEAEFAAAQKKAADLKAGIEKARADRAKLQAGTDEYNKANEAVQGFKPEIEKAEQALAEATKKAAAAKDQSAKEILAAREALKKTETDAKLVADKVAPLEKALADVKKAPEENGKMLAELREKAPGIVQAAKAAKLKAEQEAASMAKEVEKAKAEATKVRADFESKWRPAVKTASAAR